MLVGSLVSMHRVNVIRPMLARQFLLLPVSQSSRPQYMADWGGRSFLGVGGKFTLHAQAFDRIRADTVT